MKMMGVMEVMLIMLTNGFIKTISLMKPALFTKLEAGTMVTSVAQ